MSDSGVVSAPSGSSAGAEAGRITTVPLDPGALHATVAHAGAGAVVLFVGAVRDVNDGRPVVGLHYESYVAMAEREMSAILDEAGRRWPETRVEAVHRIGELRVTDLAVVVAAASAHRAAAFDACRFAIEEIKRRVPIWKAERYADGDEAWLDGRSEAPTCLSDEAHS